MDGQHPDPQDKDEEQTSLAALPLCTCAQDPFAGLPPELRPKPKAHGGLRHIKCPVCGLEYWTNRPTDVCLVCERKKVERQKPDSEA